MRAFPADSFEYFDETAVGNTALPAGLGAAARPAAGGVAVGAAAVASAPHCALRKSRQFWPSRVPGEVAQNSQRSCRRAPRNLRTPQSDELSWKASLTSH